MTELTFEEFCDVQLTYTIGMSGDWGAQRAYRNEDLGIQKETVTQRQWYGKIFDGWKSAEVYYFVDDDPRTFRTVEDWYVAWMEKVCKMPRGCGDWKE